MANGLSVITRPRDLAEIYAGVEYDTLHAMLEQLAGVPALIETWKQSKAQAIANGLLDVFTKALQGENNG